MINSIYQFIFFILQRYSLLGRFPKGIQQYSNIKKLFNTFVFSKKIHYLCIGSKNKSVLNYGGEQTQGESPAGRPFLKKK